MSEPVEQIAVKRTQPLIVSVHMPKTAGTSFRAALEANYGDRFLHDYADYPLAQSLPQRHDAALTAGKLASADDFADVGCIHGHFLPLKYLALSEQVDCRFVAWLREPVARMVSHYHYWCRSYDADSALTSMLHRRVVEEAWSLEEFCLSDELRNVYTQFLWGFPLEKLDFIGITECYERDLAVFSAQFLGVKITPEQLNRRQDEAVETLEEDLSPALRKQIEVFHSDDIELYNWAVTARVGSKGP